MTFKYEKISDEDWDQYIGRFEERAVACSGHRWWAVNEDKTCFLRKIRSLAGPEPSSEVVWHFFYRGTEYYLLVDILNVERGENWRKVKQKILEVRPMDYSREKFILDNLGNLSHGFLSTLLSAFQGYRFGVDPEKEFFCEYQLIY